MIIVWSVEAGYRASNGDVVERISDGLIEDTIQGLLNNEAGYRRSWVPLKRWMGNRFRDDLPEYPGGRLITAIVSGWLLVRLWFATMFLMLNVDELCTPSHTNIFWNS